MIERIGDKQLRHRIYLAILRGMLIAIDEKAKELGAPIIYNNGSRVGDAAREEKSGTGMLQLFGTSTSEPWAIGAMLQAPLG